MEERDSKAEDWCFVCKDGGDLILCNNGLSSHSFLMPRPSSHHILCMISSFLFSFQQLLKGVPSRMPRSRLRLPLPNPNHLSYSRRLDLRYFTPPFHSSAFYYQFPNILYIYIYTFLSSDCHHCSSCKEASEFHCFCCPTSFCNNCIESVKFIHLRPSKGLCSDCWTLVRLAEKLSFSKVFSFISNFLNSLVSNSFFPMQLVESCGFRRQRYTRVPV